MHPTASQIKAARLAANQSQVEAALVVSVNVRTWQKWEYAERKMRQSYFDLYMIKTGAHRNV